MTIDYQRLIGNIIGNLEREWLEVKHNNVDPDEMGQYISALSNSARLHDKSIAYLVWGIDDETKNPVGTSFRPRETKVGGEELENWLAHQLTPRADFRIQEFEAGGLPMVVFEIPPAIVSPVRWKGTAYVRVGSYKKKLAEHPEKERSIWSKLDNQSFETSTTASNISSDEVLTLINYPAYFELTKQPLPDSREGILNGLLAEKFIERNDDLSYNILNLGAILLANDLTKFDKLGRKVIRVIHYKGKSRIETIREASPNGAARPYLRGLSLM